MLYITNRDLNRMPTPTLRHAYRVIRAEIIAKTGESAEEFDSSLMGLTDAVQTANSLGVALVSLALDELKKPLYLSAQCGSEDDREYFDQIQRQAFKIA